MAFAWLSEATRQLGEFIDAALMEEDEWNDKQQREQVRKEIDSHTLQTEQTIKQPMQRPPEYEITPSLLEYVSDLSEHDSVFLRFPRPSSSPTSSTSPSSFSTTFEMTPYQEEHAREILAQSPKLARVRYRLCPKKITEAEFWR